MAATTIVVHIPESLFLKLKRAADLRCWSCARYTRLLDS